MLRPVQNPPNLEFTEAEKKTLIQLAREAISRRLAGEKTALGAEISQDPKLNQPAAVFVTLYKRGELRGCVGTTEAKHSLAEAVARYAVSAAMEDSRFLPLAREELPECEIEISVLSPMKRVSPREIRPGMDGVMLKRGSRQGLFLPQVWEDLKEPEKFLSLLCSQKAHLPPDAWKDPETELYTFTVTILK